jgi:radical SAM/Cys-rich protein
VKPFEATLKEHNLHLHRTKTSTLQVNVGKLCNLACRHCHMDAGQNRHEIMGKQTMVDTVDFARRIRFETAEITGGAPELVPNLDYLLTSLRPLVDKLVLRTNLVLLLHDRYSALLDLCRELKVVLVASFPSTNANQADSQRGKGVWQDSIEMLKRLNASGYGLPGTGLELNLVVNPTGAFMPVEQCRAEKKFRMELARRWDIQFTNLFTFANIPLGRFRTWLEGSGNLTQYMERLYSGFNPETLNGLMCRSLISISWDGYLYDCDFNQAADLPYSGKKIPITTLTALPSGVSIQVGDHCYACTAGAGFT